MIRIAVGWQTMIADLALILFLLTAAALTPSSTPQPPAAETGAAERTLAMELENASAVYRAEPAAPPLTEWLAEQTPDPRQRLTILSFYRPGDEAGASSRAFALLHAAGAAVPATRIVLEPAGQPQLLATLGYDLGDNEGGGKPARPQVARRLQGTAQSQSLEGTEP